MKKSVCDVIPVCSNKEGRYCNKVKLRLFKSYCLSMYDLGLWEHSINLDLVTINASRSFLGTVDWTVCLVF